MGLLKFLKNFSLSLSKIPSSLAVSGRRSFVVDVVVWRQLPSLELSHMSNSWCPCCGASKKSIACWNSLGAWSYLSIGLLSGPLSSLDVADEFVVKYSAISAASEPVSGPPRLIALFMINFLIS